MGSFHWAVIMVAVIILLWVGWYFLADHAKPEGIHGGGSGRGGGRGRGWGRGGWGGWGRGGWGGWGGWGYPAGYGWADTCNACDAICANEGGGSWKCQSCIRRYC